MTYHSTYFILQPKIYRSGKNVQFDVGIIIRRYILSHDAITHQDGYRSPGGNPGKFNDKVR